MPDLDEMDFSTVEKIVAWLREEPEFYESKEICFVMNHDKNAFEFNLAIYSRGESDDAVEIPAELALAAIAELSK